MRKILMKSLSIILVLTMLLGVLTVSTSATETVSSINIEINDINNNVVNITASAEKEATIILASYLYDELVNIKLENNTLSEGTNDYTIEGFDKGVCDRVRAFVWESQINCTPLCESLEKLQISASGSITLDGQLPETGVQIQTESSISANVPQNVVLEENAKALTLTVTTKADSDSNITLGETDSLLALDVHIEGVSKENTVPITVDLGNALAPYLNKDAIALYHIENGESVKMNCVDEFTAHNQFKYDPATGGLVLYLATFSEITMVTDTTNTWEGSRDYTWYNTTDTEFVLYNVEQLAAFGDIVRGYVEDATAVNAEITVAADSFAGKTVKLGADIEIHSEDPGETYRERYFYPIGDYTNPFKGTFDGMGHIVSNLYQNGWDMGDDPANKQYYDSHLGLFAYVNDATIQNLTIDNFNLIMELCDVGCVAAYAGGTSTFKNISIFNSDASSYNKRVAGIVGSNPNKDNGATLNFENITVDNSNSFHSLWGTWDCATAGILGKLEANSYANFKNCHASAHLDVYNDVCANYQYYWYRYCGMMIGTVSRTTTENGYTTIDLSYVKAENCTVNFGDWHDYYYCEFEENTVGSYCGPTDYQMSRVPNSEIEGTGDSATCKGHDHTEGEDRQAVYLPFRQVFGGKSWGVKGKNLAEAGLTGVRDITEGLFDSRVKFHALVKDNSYVDNSEGYTVGYFFEDLHTETIATESVMVSITSVENDEVAGTYTQNTSDWTQGTISFKEGYEGLVKITIQDYQFCTPTTIYVNVVADSDILTAIVEFNKETGNSNVGIVDFDAFLTKEKIFSGDSTTES
ncbi:MAG: hypothetical protein E7415_04580 [Ruminococcaceae bacterium]|nr:hypothetical protein [Oscillospiraceae bacterium]